MTDTRGGKVSVILTCHNYGRYVGDALASALGQTYANLEVIAVNDGSTDDSQTIIESFTPDKRLRVIAQERGGQARAKNAGLASATGEFVAFLDADDWWHPEKLARQIPLFRRAETGVVYSGRVRVDTSGHRIADAGIKELVPRRGRVTEHLFLDNFIPFSSAVVRRSLLVRAGGMDENLSMGIDWDLWLRLSTRTEFDYLPDELLFYREGHSGQMSRNLVERQRCSDRIMRAFLENHPGAVPERVVRRAWSYTFNRRGWFYRRVNLALSTRYYLMALRTRPVQWDAWRGMMANAVRLLAPARAR